MPFSDNFTRQRMHRDLIIYGKVRQEGRKVCNVGTWDHFKISVGLDGLKVITEGAKQKYKIEMPAFTRN